MLCDWGDRPNLLAESIGSLPPGWWLTVIYGLTACTPGSAPGPTLGIEHGKPLPLPFSIICTCIDAAYCHRGNNWPDCKPEGPLFSAEFVCLSVGPIAHWRKIIFSRVCLWVCLSVCLCVSDRHFLPFNVNRFWQNLATRTLVWSSLVATIMLQIGRRGTARRLFENFKKNCKKSQNSNFKILVHHFLHLCLPCIVKKNSNRFEQNWWSR